MSMEQQAAAQVSQVVKISYLPPPPCPRSASPDPSKLLAPATSGLDTDEYLSVLWEQLKTDAKKSLGVEEVGAPFTAARRPCPHKITLAPSASYSHYDDALHVQARMLDTVQLKDLESGDWARKLADEQLGQVLSPLGVEEEPLDFFLDLVRITLFMQVQCH